MVSKDPFLTVYTLRAVVVLKEIFYQMITYLNEISCKITQLTLIVSKSTQCN